MRIDAYAQFTSVTTDDVLLGIDFHDFTMSPQGTVKLMTVAQLSAAATTSLSTTFSTINSSLSVQSDDVATLYALVDSILRYFLQVFNEVPQGTENRLDNLFSN